MLRGGKGLFRNGQADPAQARSANRDQESRDALDPPGEICKPLLDQVAAGECLQIHSTSIERSQSSGLPCLLC